MNERYIINELCRIVLRTNQEIIKTLAFVVDKDTGGDMPEVHGDNSGTTNREET